jgi:hypothetical protein
MRVKQVIKKLYLRKVYTHGGQKLWFYSGKNWMGSEPIGEFSSIEEAVKQTGRAYFGECE